MNDNYNDDSPGMNPQTDSPSTETGKQLPSDSDDDSQGVGNENCNHSDDGSIETGGQLSLDSYDDSPCPTVTIAGKDCPLRVGEDTAKISLYLSWNERKEVFDRLLSARHAAESGEEENSIVELGGVEWEASPHGVGGKNGKPYMCVKLRNLAEPDVVLSLRNGDYDERCISGILDIGSLTLMCRGSLGLFWQQFLQMLQSAGAELLREVVSRVDLAIDIGNFPFAAFPQKVRKGCYIGGGRYDSEYGDNVFRKDRMPTAVYLGKKDRSLLVRIYDKMNEMGKSDEGFRKMDILTRRMGEFTELTRIEFEIRRKQIYYWNTAMSFCNHEIHGVADWHAARAEAVKYLMEDWLRFTGKVSDFKNRHQNRAKEWEAWRKIREGAVKVLREDNTVELAHPPEPVKDGSHLLSIASGNTINYMVRHQPPVSEGMVVDESIRTYSNYVKYHSESCERKYHKRMEQEKRRRKKKKGI